MRSPRCRTNSRWHKTRIGPVYRDLLWDHRWDTPIYASSASVPPVSPAEHEIIATALARLVDRLRSASQATPDAPP